MKTKKNKIIYFDYAATTPLEPRALRAMRPYLSEKFGNSMSLHSLGQEAREVLEKSRRQMAGLIKAETSEIIFTSSATESNNLALKGIALANKKRGNHLIISSIEHPCIMESAVWLEKQGFEVTRLKVDSWGRVSPAAVKKAIKKNTILVAVIHASHEIGTIQPIEKIGAVIRQQNKKTGSRIYFHVDAAQSFGKIPVDVKAMKIDLLTASAHKLYGPKGIGFIFIRKGVEIEPLLHGGGQEQGLRSSTVNLPAVVGFAAAAKIAVQEMPKENRRLIVLRDRIIKGIIEKVPGAYLNGHPADRLPNNINFRFNFVEGESIVMQLDLAGIMASTGSACSSAKLQASHVLLAIGLRPEQAHSSLRISLGRWTGKKETDYLLKVLPSAINNLRKISPF